MAPSVEIGLVTKDTSIILVDQTLDSKKDRVSYEDIGGLKEEVKKSKRACRTSLDPPRSF